MESYPVLADIGNFAMSYQPGRFPISEAIDLPIGFTTAAGSEPCPFRSC